MRKGSKRFVLEIVIDASFFEKVGGRNVFRYRQKHHFVPFTSTPERAVSNARRRLESFLREREKAHDYSLFHDSRLYREL